MVAIQEPKPNLQCFTPSPGLQSLPHSVSPLRIPQCFCIKKSTFTGGSVHLRSTPLSYPSTLSFHLCPLIPSTMSKRQAFQFLVFMIPLLVSAQPSFTVTSAVINGNITSTNTEDIRDLGFSGIIGTTPLNVYGDTIICGNGSEYDRYYQVPPFPIYGANSAAFPSKTNKQSITDFNLNSVGSAQQFCPFNSMEVPNSDYGMGITNVVATSSTEGILYFLKNYRPNPAFNDIIGAGVAVVDISGSYPTCTRTSKYKYSPEISCIRSANE